MSGGSKFTLERMKHVLICFSPAFYKTNSIQEFLCRIQANKVRKSNEDCKVEVKVLTKIEPFVQITYQDDSKQTILTEKRKIEDILAKINQRTERMDVKQLFEEAGWTEKDLNIVSNRDELPPGVKPNYGIKWNVPRDDPD